MWMKQKDEPIRVAQILKDKFVFEAFATLKKKIRKG